MKKNDFLLGIMDSILSGWKGKGVDKSRPNYDMLRYFYNVYENIYSFTVKRAEFEI